MASTSTTVPAPALSAAASRWYFSQEQLTNTPSVRAGYQLEKELSYRQQAANFIQDMGQRLKVTQLCINTAIVYMQRFYMFHSFSRFHRNTIATASLFLAAKVEEQPRKLEHVIKVAHICLHRDQPHLDPRSELYQEQAQELVTNENILLQTLGFDVAIDHPHTHVVKCCQLVRASKELAQTSYFMASNSLHLTTMCLRYSPTIVACVCIHLACKWSKYKIPLSAQNREWFKYVDSSVTLELLETLTEEFLTIFEQCPSRLKRKIMASTQATGEEEERRAHNDVAASSYQPDLSIHADPPTKHSSVPGTLLPRTSSSGRPSAVPPGRGGRPSLPNMPAQHPHHHKNDHQKHPGRHSMDVPGASKQQPTPQSRGGKLPQTAKPGQQQHPSLQKSSSHGSQPHPKHGHQLTTTQGHQPPRPSSSSSSQPVRPSSSLSNWASSLNQKPTHHSHQRSSSHDKSAQRPKATVPNQPPRPGRSIFDIDDDPTPKLPSTVPKLEVEPGEIIDDPKTGPGATQTPLSHRLSTSSAAPVIPTPGIGLKVPQSTSAKTQSPVKQPKLKLPTSGQQKQKSLFSPPSDTHEQQQHHGHHHSHHHGHHHSHHHGHHEHRKRTVSNSSGSTNGEVSVGLHKVEEISGYESLKPGTPGGKTSMGLNPQGTQDHKPMLVSIPFEEINSTGSGGHSHKSKKSKKDKKKKDKKEKRDRSSERHKSKHREKDKTRHHHDRGVGQSKSSEVPAASSESSIPKLKIKLGEPDEGSLKMKFCFDDKNQGKKRPRENGTTEDPALKMSRALGSSYETESLFLADNSTKLKKVK